MKFCQKMNRRKSVRGQQRASRKLLQRFKLLFGFKASAESVKPFEEFQKESKNYGQDDSINYELSSASEQELHKLLYFKLKAIAHIDDELKEIRRNNELILKYLTVLYLNKCKLETTEEPLLS